MPDKNASCGWLRKAIVASPVVPGAGFLRNHGDYGLGVLAFMLMGLQARLIIEHLSPQVCLATVAPTIGVQYRTDDGVCDKQS
jgi:hypothetical protein